MELIKEPPQARRGVDYLVAVFYAASQPRHQEIFDQVMTICEEIQPNWPFIKAGSSPHYESVFSNQLGMRIELTTCDSIGGRNKGSICLSLPGTCWWIQDSVNQALCIWKISKIPGFKHFTRIDFQNTELEPEWPMLRVRDAVLNGEIWVKGAQRKRIWQETDFHGDPIGGVTCYWASTRSEKQPKTYDKGADNGWHIPAIRDEVLTRGRWANEHGRMLLMDLDRATTSAEMVEVVNRHTESALNQHLLYFTLNGADPKTDKNWKRQAEPADWYLRRIGKRCEPIQKAPKASIDLDTTVDYGVQQYGRYFYRWVVEQSRKHDLPMDFVLNSLFMRFQSRLRREDEDWLLDGLDEQAVADFRRDLEEKRDQVSRAQERGWWVRE